MPEENAFELRVDTGAVTVPIYDSNDGELLGEFKFNPNDMDIVKRYEQVADALNKISVPEDAGNEALFAVSDEMKKQLDFLLNYPVSAGIFAKCNPLTLTANGDFYIENVIEGIGNLIEKTMKVRLDKKMEKVRRATEKYNK